MYNQNKITMIGRIYVMAYSEPNQFLEENGLSSVIIKVGSTTRYSSDRVKREGGQLPFSIGVELSAWRIEHPEFTEKSLLDLESAIRFRLESLNSNWFGFLHRENFSVDVRNVGNFINLVEEIINDLIFSSGIKFLISKTVDFDAERKKFISCLPSLKRRYTTLRSIVTWGSDLERKKQERSIFVKYLNSVLPWVNEKDKIEINLRKEKQLLDDIERSTRGNLFGDSLGSSQDKLFRKIEKTVKIKLENPNQRTPKKGGKFDFEKFGKLPGDIVWFCDPMDHRIYFPLMILEDNFLVRYYDPDVKFEDRDQTIYTRVGVVDKYHSDRHVRNLSKRKSETWPWKYFIFEDKECTISFEKLRSRLVEESNR